jgi:RNA polymerase sigma-B factor
VSAPGQATDDVAGGASTRTSAEGRTRPDVSSPEGIDRTFRAYRAEGSRGLRNALVEVHLDLVEFHVRRFSRRGVTEDDLRQVGYLALIRAVERFDPEVGVAFSTFAGRTIEGEVKRWFRDRTWNVRPPRRAQELHLELRRAADDLSQTLGRAPRVRELAVHLGESEDRVLEALEAGQAHNATSIDAPGPDPDGTGDSGRAAERILSTGESGFGDVDDRMIVAELLAGLPEREQEVLRLRFFENLSQEEIAERVGVSQSYLSRVLRRTLSRLREELEEAGVDAAAVGAAATGPAGAEGAEDP